MPIAKKRVLITGANSLMGYYLWNQLKLLYDIVLMYHHNRPVFGSSGTQMLKCDVSDSTEVRSLFQSVQPAVVIHLAALSDIDYCENHAELAQKINIGGTRNVATNSGKNCHLVFFSSSMVFSGKHAPYDESDEPHPVNIYGKTKIAAEKTIQKMLLDNATIIRSSTIFGWQPDGARLNILTSTLLELESNRPLNLISDCFFNPVSARNVAQSIEYIIKNSHTGIFHIGGQSRVSRFGFVQLLIDYFNLKIKSPLNKVPGSFFTNLAPRPKDVTLSTKRITSVFPNFSQPLDKDLRSFLQTTIPLNYQKIIQRL